MLFDMISTTPNMILGMVSKNQQKKLKINAFHSIITDGSLYDLGYGI